MFLSCFDCFNTQESAEEINEAILAKIKKDREKLQQRNEVIIKKAT